MRSPSPKTNTYVDSLDSIDNVREEWIGKVTHSCAGVPIILVGCKTDSRRDPRVIWELCQTNQLPVKPKRYGMAIAQKIGAKHYLECSAKSDEGVWEVFNRATRAALLSRPKGSRTRQCLLL